jgi:serine/threonine-protein kinase
VVVGVLQPDGTNLWLGDGRGGLAPLTARDGDDRFPMFSRDGSRVVFASTRSGGGLFMRPVGGGDATVLVRGVEWQPSTWTADGRLVYEQLRGAAIVVAGARESAQSLTLVNDSSYFDVLHPSVSPDGRWIAYHSTESGRSEAYVRPFPNVNDGRWVVSTQGGHSPVWSTDGRELYYIESQGQTRSTRMPDGYLTAVAVRTQPAFAATAPERLFSVREFVLPTTQGREFDVAPDGRFLLLKDATVGRSRAGAQIAVVQHWLDDLRARVPAAR